MSSLNNSPSLEEAVNTMRDNILRTQSQSNTASITAFDNMVSQLRIFAQQINDKNVEIKRLQELCKTSNVDFTIPPVAKPPTSAEAPKTLKPKN